MPELNRNQPNDDDEDRAIGIIIAVLIIFVIILCAVFGVLPIPVMAV